MCSTTDKSSHACTLLESMICCLRCCLANAGGNKIGMVTVQYWLDFLCFVLLSCNVVRTQVHGYAESCLFTGRGIKMKLVLLLFGRWRSCRGSGCWRFLRA